jgi:multicomponent Na+:H+ antiporter subunit D
VNLVNLLPLAVAVPFIAAAVLAATGKLIHRRVADAIAIATSAFVAVVGWLLIDETQRGRMVYWFGGWVPRDGVALGISFVADETSAGLTLLVGLLTTAAFVFALRYFDSVHALFHVMMLIFMGAMCGFSLTGDLFNLFVFFQLMSAAAFVLCAYKTEEPGPLQGALNFGVTNTIAAFLTVSGIAMVYGRTGALNLAQIGRALGPGNPDALVIFAFALILCGFFIKAAIVPFHFWLADAHAMAPTPVCVLFSGVMVALGLSGTARVYWTIFDNPLGGEIEALRAVLVAAGVLTALLGAIMCFMQHHIKRLLAFSTISHMGLALVAFGLLTSGAQSGLAAYVVGHGVVKAALFMGAGILLHRFASVDELELRGRGRPLPVVAALFVLGGLGLASLPPFATFLGEAHIEDAAEKLGYSWLALVFFAAAALTGGAVLRCAGRVFAGWGAGKEEETSEDPQVKETPETLAGHDHTPASMVAPAVALLLFGLLVTVLPGLEHTADLAAIQMQDRVSYAARVLDATALQLPPPEPHGPILPGVLRGLASSLGAVGLAGVALRSRARGRARSWHPSGVATPRSITNALGEALAGLRRIHSGRPGDYVAWLTVGVAAFGAILNTLLR